MTTPLQQATAMALIAKIYELGHTATSLPEVSEGPLITIYRVLPTGATKVSHIEGLAQDFAITLGVDDVLVKRIPGEAAVGISIPNKERLDVDFKQSVSEVWKLRDSQKIPLNLGVDYLGRPCVVDLTTLPHLLIAGSTDSGKSTLLGAIIASLIYCLDSDSIRLVLSDTKGVEFGHFVGAPHLLFEPATSVYQTLERMDWLIAEMDRRFKLLGKENLRNVLEFNLQRPDSKLPYIAFLIDELADVVGDDSRLDGNKGPGVGKVALSKLGKLAQKSRATGVHIIAATQRPSVKLIAGDIKSNFPSRLSFRLPSGVDSQVVLDQRGAEHLLTRGDMLFLNPSKQGLLRLHAPHAKLRDITAATEMAIMKGGSK